MSSKPFELKPITIETDVITKPNEINSDILREMSRTKHRKEFDYVNLSKKEKRQCICNLYNTIIEQSKLEIIGTISKEEMVRRGRIIQSDNLSQEEKLEQTKKYFEQHGITDLELL